MTVAVVLSAVAFGSILVGWSALLATGCMLLLNLLTIVVLLVVLRRASLRAESVARIERQVERLALRTAADAQSNHRELLAAIEQLTGDELAGEVER